MENEQKPINTENTDSEQDKINNPQHATQPQFNSTSTSRKADELPAIENLNQHDGLNDSLRDAKDNLNPLSVPKNDASIHGDAPKTDLGNDHNDHSDEEIIST